MYRDYRNEGADLVRRVHGRSANPFAVNTGGLGIAPLAHHALAITAGAERVGKSAMLDSPPTS